MGACGSKGGSDEVFDIDTVPGLLSIDDLGSIDCRIGNLVFADGGAKAFAYVGALKVLEHLGLMKGVRRFAGVGTGALIAAPLAIGLNCDSVQKFFKQCLDSFDFQEKTTGMENSLKISSCFGMVSGGNFLDRFNLLLESRSLPVGLTFGQLYQRTGIELCIIVSNLTNKTIEHCHPKTTPDLPVNQALIMSLCVPGIFAPPTYSFGSDECYYLGGNLTCSYPLHAYDVWWLSMDYMDSFPNRKQATRRFHQSESYFMRNQKSLGLVLLDRFQESNYPELRDRLYEVHADARIPETPLGIKYQRTFDNLRAKESEYLLVREGGFKLLKMVGEIEEDILSEKDLARMIMERDSITAAERNALFSTEINSVDECLLNLLKLNKYDAEMHKSDLSAKVENIMLRKLRDYYDTDTTTVTSLDTFFGALSNTVQSSSFELTKEDFQRTVGILCKYVCSYNTALEKDDLMFLFKQGWNSTVAYFRYIIQEEKKDMAEDQAHVMTEEMRSSLI